MSNAKDQIGAALEQPIPDLIEPIVGYRYWEWDARGLRSYRKTEWVPGQPLKAECLAGGNQWIGTRVPLGDNCGASPSDPYKAPELDARFVDGITTADLQKMSTQDIEAYLKAEQQQHDPIHGEYGCGIYAYRTIEDAWGELHDLNAERHILGKVHLWGKVWPHEKGYRAEYAKPLAFFRPLTSVNTIWGDPIEALGRFYDCAVEDLPLDEEQRKAIEDESRQRYKRTLLTGIGGLGSLVSGRSSTAGSRSLTYAALQKMWDDALIVPSSTPQQPKSDGWM